MSLKYRDYQGNEVPISGLNGTSGELVPSVSLYQKGSKLSDTSSWAPGESGIFTIAFSTPMPDTNYDVILGIDTPEINVSAAYDKSVNGFKAKVENVSSVTYAGRIEIFWQAFKLMADESRALDEAKTEQNTKNFAPNFSATASYAVGDYTIYNGQLYRCTVQHTASAWNSSHFTATNVGGELFPNVSSVTSIIDTENFENLHLDIVQMGRVVTVTGEVHVKKKLTEDKLLCYLPNGIRQITPLEAQASTIIQTIPVYCTIEDSKLRINSVESATWLRIAGSYIRT